MTRIKLFCLGFVLLFACGELSRNPGVEDGGIDAGVESTRAPCSECAGANKCFAGECLRTCGPLPGFECEVGLHCLEEFCLPESVPSCEESPCNRDQACVSTYCLEAAARSCSPGESECFSDEACLGDPPTCVSLPFCNLDETCRAGTMGAVCNIVRFGALRVDPRFDLDRCLIGHCTSNDHCPAPLTCQEIGAEVEGLGVCR